MPETRCLKRYVGVFVFLVILSLLAAYVGPKIWRAYKGDRDMDAIGDARVRIRKSPETAKAEFDLLRAGWDGVVYKEVCSGYLTNSDFAGHDEGAQKEWMSFMCFLGDRDVEQALHLLSWQKVIRAGSTEPLNQYLFGSEGGGSWEQAWNSKADRLRMQCLDDGGIQITERP
ncbi:MAG: hypothetical protein H6839_01425 [Planctomycetes bacterium]|nr:hypothetical protein [Planctomycetota bacterium]